ncbi:uncharacterized protein LOC133304587 [Gastrolobium bilobum]|uniref:uncharacterized protein LOC133304587 n=1 Tax=Gastrolobium bilobum TaxID=150636 RepID=UPI002AB1EF58|nr:uncharacterized protein LOC133304587 [Gastrolobium bilobum]
MIFVVVDKLSKASHFGMLPTNFTTAKAANLFAHMVCHLHGMPRSIISDRDTIFVSHFWQELFRLSGTKLRMPTTYHPQSLTLFQVVYRREPPIIPQYVIGTSNVEAVDSILNSREQIQNTVAKCNSHKLTKKYYGPFKIIKCIGEVAFELELPTNSKIHPVFNASLLKHYHVEDAARSLALPSREFLNQPVIQPMAILDMQEADKPEQTCVLIQWQGLYPKDSSWELLSEMMEVYPDLHLKDKVFVQDQRVI